MSQGVFRKRGGALWPVDPLAGEIVRRIKQGGEALCDVTVPRSPKQNKFVHALLHEIVENTERFYDIDDLKRFLKIRTRMYTTRVMPDGEVVLELQRTAFGSMDQLMFNRVWNRWKWVLKNEVIPDIDDEALRMRILEQIA